MRDFFDATEGQVVKLIDDVAIREAEYLISGCEACSEDAWLLFDDVLDAVTGENPNVNDYIMLNEASCPRCRHKIYERSLVKPRE
jgi:hypothetical protein